MEKQKPMDFDLEMLMGKQMGLLMQKVIGKVMHLEKQKDLQMQKDFGMEKLMEILMG